MLIQWCLSLFCGSKKAFHDILKKRRSMVNVAETWSNGSWIHRNQSSKVSIHDVQREGQGGSTYRGRKFWCLALMGKNLWPIAHLFCFGFVRIHVLRFVVLGTPMMFSFYCECMAWSSEHLVMVGSSVSPWVQRTLECCDCSLFWPPDATGAIAN